MVEGFRFLPEYFPPAAQKALVAEILAILEANPLYRGAMPRSGAPLSSRDTNLGPLGWVSDIKVYRYQPTHPVTGKPWPPMPPRVTDLWQTYSACPFEPEACLINFYSEDAKMGLHQDRDEAEFSAPVLSISLGDACLFRVGGTRREERTVSFRLESGDIVLIGGENRLAFHGVDRIYPATSALLKNGGRINLTLRRVSKPS